MLLSEPGADDLAHAIADDPRRLVSAATVLEASIVLEDRLGEAAGRELDLLLHRLGARVMAVSADQAEIARSAWRRFGKGRHPAGLNFGDCFSYALSVDVGEPLLFKGDDFGRTDVSTSIGSKPGSCARLHGGLAAPLDAGRASVAAVLVERSGNGDGRVVPHGRVEAGAARGMAAGRARGAGRRPGSGAVATAMTWALTPSMDSSASVRRPRRAARRGRSCAPPGR